MVSSILQPPSQKKPFHFQNKDNTFLAGKAKSDIQSTNTTSLAGKPVADVMENASTSTFLPLVHTSQGHEMDLSSIHSVLTYICLSLV